MFITSQKVPNYMQIDSFCILDLLYSSFIQTAADDGIDGVFTANAIISIQFYIKSL